MMVIKQSGLLQTHHVAEILCCTERHVRNLIKTGELPAHKIGKRGYRIQRQTVMEYLERTKVDAEKNYE